jgi:Carboxypeptidase regulatory-like domain
MTKRLPSTLLQVAPLAAVFALGCALLAPASPPAAGRSRSREAAARQTQAKPSPTPLPSESTIVGRAVYDDTSRPVRRARVMLVSDSGARTEYAALTNAEGEFVIVGVRAGVYMAFVDLPGLLSPVSFISLEALRGSTPDFAEARQFFDVIEVDGRQQSRVTLHARRGGALGGRVVYADGDPAVNVAVNVMRRGADGRLERRLFGINVVSFAALRTDDRGVFRVSGLPPGDYVVSVSEPAEHGGLTGARVRDPLTSVFEGLLAQQFLTTFYPSATTAKEARVVKVEAGLERSDIDITIPERGLHTVEGVVRGKRDGRPVASAQVYIVRRDDEVADVPIRKSQSSEGDDYEQAQTYTTTDSQGHWAFTEIPDGQYTITVRPREEYEAPDVDAALAEAGGDPAAAPNGNRNASPGRAPRLKKHYAPARRDVQVSGGDVSEVAVELNDGGRIAGTIAYEGGEEREYMYVTFRRVPEAGEAPGEWNATSMGGTFVADGLPAGKYFVAPSTSSEEGGAYVKSITWNGRDVMREPIELGDGASAEGVSIVMSRGTSKLRVRATGAARKWPARSVAVYLLPADLSAWSPYAAQLSCTTGDEGTCTIVAPPGGYRVVALPRPGDAGEDVRKRAAAATVVMLAAGESKDVELDVPER